MILAAGLFVAGLGLGVLAWINRPAAPAKPASSYTTLTSLADFTLLPPADLDGMKPFDLGVPEAKDFRSGTPEDGCELQFGIFSAAQVPGTDLGDMVARQLESVRQNGGSVAGPSSAPALILKDTSGKQTYSLPTLAFSIVLPGSRGMSHYSAGVLADGRRVAVTRVCVAKAGRPAPTGSTLQPVNEVAARIAVKLR